jgi:serine/threonine protein kinase
VKLLDFGVAMSAVTEQSEALIVGKWLYMSPEHTTNQQIDHTSDLFSLGVILYLLCTGHVPFTGQDPKAIVRKIRAGQYTPLQEHVPDAPPSLAALVARLLSPKPEDRPQTGQEVAAALVEIMRNNGLECTGSDIAYFVGALLADDNSSLDSVSRAKLSSEEISLPKKVAAGSGPQHDAEVDEHSRSLSAKAAPHGVVGGDSSLSRRRKENTTPPLPSAPRSKSTVLVWVLIILALVALAAIATRLVFEAM